MAESGVEVSVVNLLDVLKQGKLDDLLGGLEKLDHVYFKVYRLPRPVVRIRAASKRIVVVDEGKLARLEYSFLLSLLEAAKKGVNPVFRDFAVLVGDYKAAAGYLVEMWREGLVVPGDRSKMLDLLMAYNSLSQRGYERRIARALDMEFRLATEAIEKLGSERIICVYRDGKLGCKYTVSKALRSQAKAQVKAFNDAIRKG